jgi:ArsR family transcriptional regulator
MTATEPDRQTRHTAAVFLALSSPVRLQVLQAVMRSPDITQGAVCRAVGQSQANVSYHLFGLRMAGAVTGRKAGKFMHYTATPAVRRLWKAATAESFSWTGLDKGERVNVV